MQDVSATGRKEERKKEIKREREGGRKEAGRKKECMEVNRYIFEYLHTRIENVKT